MAHLTRKFHDLVISHISVFLDASGVLYLCICSTAAMLFLVHFVEACEVFQIGLTKAGDQTAQRKGTFNLQLGLT